MRVRDRVQVLLALLAIGVVSFACKYSYTPPGPVDASVDAVAALAVAPVGSCKPESGNTTCVAGGQAAFCKSRLVHDGPKHTSWAGDWVTFTCPDCKKADPSARIHCSDYKLGEPCDRFVVNDMCRPDKRAMYRCDAETSRWEADPCPGGCEQTYQIVCNP